MKKTLILFVLFLSISCQNDSNIELRIMDIDSAIKEMKNEDYTNQLFKNKFETTLNDSETVLFKNILSTTLDHYNSKREQDRRIDINKYRFLIIPTMNDKKEKIIFVYSYAFDYGEEWYSLKDWFNVKDGGNSYFSTVINLTQKTEGWIVPNGEA